MLKKVQSDVCHSLHLGILVTAQAKLCHVVSAIHGFHLARDCPDKNRMNTNFGSTGYDDQSNQGNPPSTTIDFGQLDLSIDEYNFTPVDEDKEGQAQKQDTNLYTCFMSLVYNIEHEYHNPQTFYVNHARPVITPSAKEL